MKYIATITIEASDTDGIINSINEVAKKIQSGFTSGMDSNDEENYNFYITKN